MPGKLSRVETRYVAYGNRRLFEPLRSNDLVVVQNVMTEEIEDLSDV